MVLTPVDAKDLRKISSKDLVDMFVDADIEAAQIDVTETGRDIDNVYTALTVYLKNHPNLGVRVTQSGGKLFLMKRGGGIPQK